MQTSLSPWDGLVLHPRLSSHRIVHGNIHNESIFGSKGVLALVLSKDFQDYLLVSSNVSMVLLKSELAPCFSPSA